MTIDCILCFRDEDGAYFKNAYVVLLSLFENTAESIRVHILHDETISAGREHLSELCQRFGHEIRFHPVPALDPETARAVSGRFNIGATYLFHAHEFVDADKAVYLDCDVVVNRDIADLYRIDLGHRLFASTLDFGPYWKRKGQPAARYRKLIDYFGLRPESYISSGLLLMNLSGLRTLSVDGNIFVQKTLDAIRDGIRLPYPDMDVLNGVAAMVPDGVLVIDTSFNLWHNSLHLGINELKGTIFHYVSKPDKEFFPAHLLFWQYYAKTPFAADMFPRMSAAFTRMRFVNLYARFPRHRRHATEILEYGFLGMLGRAVGRKLGLIRK